MSINLDDAIYIITEEFISNQNKSKTSYSKIIEVFNKVSIRLQLQNEEKYTNNEFWKNYHPYVDKLHKIHQNKHLKNELIKQGKSVFDRIIISVNTVFDDLKLFDQEKISSDFRIYRPNLEKDFQEINKIFEKNASSATWSECAIASARFYALSQSIFQLTYQKNILQGDLESADLVSYFTYEINKFKEVESNANYLFIKILNKTKIF